MHASSAMIQNESNGNSESDGECNLNLAIINFRSIINKKAEFLYFLQERKPRIIIGTETWLSNDIADNEIIPSEFNYTIYRKDRDSGYGGVMIAVSKDILSSPVPELVTSCEMTWCKLHFPGIKNVHICAYYRPHVIQDHGLSQVVMEPTRCGNILDLFFMNNPGQVQAVKILPGLSDHDIVSLQINCKPTILRQKPRQILLFNKANWEAFRSGVVSFYEGIAIQYRYK